MKGRNMTEEDPKLKMMGYVLDAVSISNSAADALEKLMNDHPAEEYSIPAEHLIRIASLLRLDATLVSKLFEENQTIADQIADLLRKYATPKK